MVVRIHYFIEQVYPFIINVHSIFKIFPHFLLLFSIFYLLSFINLHEFYYQDNLYPHLVDISDIFTSSIMTIIIHFLFNFSNKIRIIVLINNFFIFLFL